jgi:hypothetical protein
MNPRLKTLDLRSRQRRSRPRKSQHSRWFQAGAPVGIRTPDLRFRRPRRRPRRTRTEDDAGRVSPHHEWDRGGTVRYGERNPRAPNVGRSGDVVAISAVREERVAGSARGRRADLLVVRPHGGEAAAADRGRPPTLRGRDDGLSLCLLRRAGLHGVDDVRPGVPPERDRWDGDFKFATPPYLRTRESALPARICGFLAFCARMRHRDGRIAPLEPLTTMLCLSAEDLGFVVR